MPRIIDLLRQRHPELLAEQARTYRWLQSAKRNRFKVAIAALAYERATVARLRAENAIRRELDLPEVPELADPEVPR